jgi:hypothetical protein
LSVLATTSSEDQLFCWVPAELCVYTRRSKVSSLNLYKFCLLYGIEGIRRATSLRLEFDNTFVASTFELTELLFRFALHESASWKAEPRALRVNIVIRRVYMKPRTLKGWYICFKGGITCAAGRVLSLVANAACTRRRDMTELGLGFFKFDRDVLFESEP